MRNLLTSNSALMSTKKSYLYDQYYLWVQQSKFSMRKVLLRNPRSCCTYTTKDVNADSQTEMFVFRQEPSESIYYFTCGKKRWQFVRVEADTKVSEVSADVLQASAEVLKYLNDLPPDSFLPLITLSLLNKSTVTYHPRESSAAKTKPSTKVPRSKENGAGESKRKLGNLK